MDQRLQFVTDALGDRFTMTELCERYGVSRRIGYKWLARFTEDGKRGLADRSRRPVSTALALHRERAREPDIGLEETDDGVWASHFNTVLLATLDERDFVIRG